MRAAVSQLTTSHAGVVAAVRALDDALAGRDSERALARWLKRAARRSRKLHRRARKRLDSHASSWMEAAHSYGATIAGSGQPERTLTRVIDGDGEWFALDDADPYDVLILGTLRKCHPAPLTETLDAVSRRL
jgi:hypothetical protein